MILCELSGLIKIAKESLQKMKRYTLKCKRKDLTMKLVLLGDLHYPTLESSDAEGIQIRNTLFQTLFQCLAEEKADAYICVGDLTNSGTLQDLKNLIDLSELLNSPFYFVMGNHDTYGCSKEDFIKISQKKRYYAVDMPQANLYFVDTTLESRVDDWIGIMDDEEYLWLQEKVRKSTKPIFIIAHHPVSNTTRRSDERKLQLHENMWDILNQKPKGIYINGHNHLHSIVKQRGWLFIQTGDFLSHLDYRILCFDGHRGTIETKSLKDRLVGVDQLTQKMKRYTKYSDLSYPNEDLNCEFILE